MPADRYSADTSPTVPPLRLVSTLRPGERLSERVYWSMEYGCLVRDVLAPGTVTFTLGGPINGAR